jgi:NAD(P)H-dependent FMN reductase
MRIISSVEGGEVRGFGAGGTKGAGFVSILGSGWRNATILREFKAGVDVGAQATGVHARRVHPVNGPSLQTSSVTIRCLLAPRSPPRLSAAWHRNRYTHNRTIALTHTLNIIVGSTRPGRVAPIFANWFKEFAAAHGKFEPVLVDIADFDLPLFDEPKHPRLGDYENEHTKRWSQTIAAADAFVFVTPEYNYFVPAPLVNAVTYLSAEWRYKPAGFLSYGGVSGGLRAVESAKPLLTTLKVVPIPEGVPVPNYPQLLADGEFKPNDLIAAGAKTMLDELHRWSVALKPMRA